MFETFLGNMMITEYQRMNKEEITVVIYETADSVTDQDFKTYTNTHPLQTAGSECVKNRSFRSVSVCLVVLCVLLLTAVIVLCVLIHTNNHQCHIKNKNITEERDQMLTNITEERDQLLTKYTNITQERDELKINYNNISKLYEKLNKEKTELLTHLNDGWIYYKFILYYISSEKKSWTESRRYCTDRGADLIIINNREEHDFIKKISVEFIWIGLSDSDVEETWKWVDGSTLTTDFWAPGEPSSHRGDNCAVSFLSQWYDHPCSTPTKWICERKK